MYICLLLLKAPVYIKEYTRLYFTGSKTLQSKVSVSALCLLFSKQVHLDEKRQC